VPVIEAKHFSPPKMDIHAQRFDRLLCG